MINRFSTYLTRQTPQHTCAFSITPALFKMSINSNENSASGRPGQCYFKKHEETTQQATDTKYCTWESWQ